MRAKQFLIGKAFKENYRLILLRMASMVLLAYSAAYWGQLTGATNMDIRFDTMTVPARATISTLAVLQPVASLGLWGGWRWGIVLWIVIAAIEFTMYGLYPQVFGQANLVLLFHVTGLGVYFLALLASFAMNAFKGDETV
ncbi:MAG: DUF6163 family protein [Pseudomonadota bacterium]